MLSRTNKWLSVAVLSSAAVSLSLLASPGLASAADPRTPSSTGAAAAPDPEVPRDLDVRQLAGTPLDKAERSLESGQGRAAEAFVKGLGSEAIVDRDPLTGTPRQLARLDGYLSGPQAGTAREIALDFVRTHLAVLGLTSEDLSTLVLRKDYVDPVGMHHLSWEQQVDGTLVFGNGLQINVTKDGRVLSVLGSPVSGLQRLADQAEAEQTRGVELSAGQARVEAATDVDAQVESAKVADSTGGADAETTWANHDNAAKVWFLTPAGLQSGWSTYTQTAEGSFQHVLDADSGRTLYRHATSDQAVGDGYVYRYYPGAFPGPTGIKGGQPSVVNFIARGWLAKTKKVLDGTNVITWADLNDDDRVSPGEQTPVPGTKTGATGKLTTYKDTSGVGTTGPAADHDFSRFCIKNFVCTWDPQRGYSWKANLQANENNAFYLANTFHDYLQNDKAIGFTPQAGNFTTAGGDPVLQQVLDGADTGPGGFPTSSSTNNAVMSTPPDGIPPTMQMFLFHTPRAANDRSPFLPTSGAFDPSVLLHEYTHGLSNRLTIDAAGNSTLASLQAKAMGEAWSDYYAMDYLVTRGLQKNTAAAGDVISGKYIRGGQYDAEGRVLGARSMPIDCPVQAASKICYDTQNPDAEIQGGYTYGDLADVSGFAESHSSGEVWAQTLWDIRAALGHTVADTVITRAMSLSVADPSMLDMRNAIIQADLVAYGSSHTPQLWKIFAQRGMGYFAASEDASDTDVVEDFHVAPNPKQHNQAQQIRGIVTDSVSGDPVPGISVKASGFGQQLSAVTGADGRYVIGTDGLYAGTYSKVLFSGVGYLAEWRAITVPQGAAATVDLTMVRDWAMTSGGAELGAFDGVDRSSFGCGPTSVLDGDLATGWLTDAGAGAGPVEGPFQPKRFVVKLPQAVDVSGFGIDPASACLRSADVSTGDYSIEVSSDGDTWTPVADGTFHPADAGHLNQVAPDGDADEARYVRFTILGNQVAEVAAGDGLTGSWETICHDLGNADRYSGCVFAGLAELEVFGTPAR